MTRSQFYCFPNDFSTGLGRLEKDVLEAGFREGFSSTLSDPVPGDSRAFSDGFPNLYPAYQK